ncbi:cyanophycinase [Pelomonas sp. KK5]|uniref:cyanophycinase n=1 Tax=Pelomonas sp. KK5 TaxID=1855730 RepID=UPI00097C37FB|nr:cyanophycinase [Pelomonas sp. KK5]
MRRRLFCLSSLPLLLSATLQAAAADDPNDAPVKGWAVAIGGALRNDNDEVWQRVVDLAGGRGARFVVLGTASEDPEASGRSVVRLLARRGAVAELLPVGYKFPGDVRDAVRDPALIDKVRKARGVFFTGGSQERIVDVLQPGGQRTPLLDAIWDLYRDGGVVAGSSAGAAIMSRAMFRDAPNIVDVMKGKWSEGTQVDRGLGFVGPDLFVDQHFLRRGRVGRMIPLMQAKGYRLGLGVDENTAAVVHGEEIEIIGGRGALLVDLAGSSTDAALGVFNVRGARLSYLDHGDLLNLRTQHITPSAAKLRGERLQPGAPGFEPYYTEDRFDLDMLGDSTLVHAMAQLIDSKKPEVQGLAFDARVKAGEPLADLGFHFRLYKAEDTMGWGSTEAGVEEYTVLNVRLDVTPVRMPTPLFGQWPPAR